MFLKAVLVRTPLQKTRPNNDRLDLLQLADRIIAKLQMSLKTEFISVCCVIIADMHVSYLDHSRRGERQPLVQRDIFVLVSVEDLEELERRVSDVLNIVTEARGNVA
jgi:hypothetical protein